MRARCVSTVRSLMNNRSPIMAFDRPSAIE
jgi:hypothetical protein